MKKHLLLAILMLLPLVASADAVEIDGLYYNLNAESKTAEVTSNPKKYSGDIVIPESVISNNDTYCVTSIAGVSSLIIHDRSNLSFSKYENSAFIDCYDLTSVTIPNSVTSIGDGAFWGCNGLTSLALGNGVSFIGDMAFANCSGLTSVTIPNSVASIGDGAFWGCTNLTSITIPNYVTSIGNYAFFNCNCMISVIIPNSVTFMGSYAFLNCSALTSVTIPNSVTSIGDSVFEGCWRLTSVTIPNSVTSLGSSAFWGCFALTSITIPSNVTSISDEAFRDCSDLESVTILAQSPPEMKENSFSNYDIPLYVPKGARDAYLAVSPWNKFKEIIEYNTTDETDVDVIKISSAGQSTWCSAYDLDFTNVEGIKAYTATGYDRETGTIWLTRVQKVSANEGLLIIGKEGEYKVQHKSTTTYYANFMKGTLKAITINEKEGEYTNYYLSNGSYGVGFYKVNGTQAISANRAYLPLLKGNVPAGTRFISLGFEDGEGTTGINGVKSGEVKSREWFTLQGQRVNNPGKGLYIKNGKKVIIK